MSIATIQIARKKSKIPDDAYRLILYDVAQVRSSKDAAPEKHSAIVSAIWRCMSKPTGGHTAADACKNEPVVKKIWGMWYKQLSPLLRPDERSTAYLVGIVRKAASAPDLQAAKDFNRLDGAQLFKAVEAIKCKIGELGGMI